MVDAPVHTLGVLFAIIGATGAGLLALLFRRSLRESAFGTVVALLSATMSATILYHVVLFLFAPDSLLLDALRSALYTALAVFLWLVVVTHQRLEQMASGGELP